MDSKAQDIVQDPEKSIFIIKVKPDALTNAESWLRGKGWTINSTAVIREALPKIIEMKPKYVMVCMDHPNSKVRMLPKLLEQAFQIQIIAYLDSTNPRSIAQLTGQEYILYPPITGTAIDRMCSKIERDKRRRSEVAQQRTDGNLKQSLGTTDDTIINVKGSANLAPSHTHIQEQARKALMDIIKSEETNSAGKSTATQDGHNQNSFQVAQSGPAPSPTPGTLRHSSKAKSDAAAEGAVESDSKANPKNAAILEGKDPSKSQGGLIQQGTSTSKPKGAMAEDTNADQKGDESKASAADSSADSASDAKDNSPRGLRAKLAKAKSLLNFIRPDNGLKEDSSIVESVHIAIDQSAKPDATKPTHALGICSEMICFPVGSSHHHGYVLCAMAKNSQPLLSFMEVFREKLTAVMSETEKHFTTGEPLPLSLTPVPFEEFAHHQADLFSKFVHLDRECAIAYIDEEMPEPLQQTPVQADMIPVSLKEVHAERPLEFDLFLHLPQNEKFVRYGKKDNQITSKQKTKLEKRGIAAMHLHESQRFDLFRHRLQIFMNGKIAAFENSKPELEVKSI